MLHLCGTHLATVWVGPQVRRTTSDVKKYSGQRDLIASCGLCRMVPVILDSRAPSTCCYSIFIQGSSTHLQKVTFSYAPSFFCIALTSEPIMHFYVYNLLTKGIFCQSFVLISQFLGVRKCHYNCWHYFFDALLSNPQFFFVCSTPSPLPYFVNFYSLTLEA